MPNTLPVALYDPAFSKPEGIYWPFAAPAVSREDQQMLKPLLLSGFPDRRVPKPETPQGGWSVGLLRTRGAMWFYRMYWAGRDGANRPGRYFFVVMKLEYIEEMLDSAVAQFLVRFEGRQSVPLPESDWGLNAVHELRLAGSDTKERSLRLFMERAGSLRDGQHIGCEIEAGESIVMEFNQSACGTEIAGSIQRQVISPTEKAILHTGGHSKRILLVVALVMGVAGVCWIGFRPVQSPVRPPRQAEYVSIFEMSAKSFIDQISDDLRNIELIDDSSEARYAYLLGIARGGGIRKSDVPMNDAQTVTENGQSDGELDRMIRARLRELTADYGKSEPIVKDIWTKVKNRRHAAEKSDALNNDQGHQGNLPRHN